MEEFKERAKELGLKIYQPTVEYDIIFARWWETLHETGEYDRLFTRRIHPLSQFMHTFQPPTLTIFADDEDGIWVCAWFNLFSDTDSGAFMHFWGREEKRNTRKGISVTSLIYDFATTFFPVVIGVTKHEDLLYAHRKVGYNIVGQIPHMLDGSDVWILYLTRENFEQGKLFKLGEKINGFRNNRKPNGPRNAANYSGVLV